MTFSIRQLQFFVAVAEAGQISRAARDLYVSQSSVTAAVQEIERHLNHTLFTRSARGVELTPVGAQFLPKARRILQLVADATLVTASDEEIAGRLRVGVSYTVMAYFLPHHIQRLSILYPNLEITWLEMARADAEQQLLDGGLDFGLLLTSNIRDPAIQHETFIRSKRRLWMATGHPLSSRTDLRLRDVSAYPYAQLTIDEADETTRQYWGTLSRQTFLETSSIEAVRSVVANGNGVTILSDMVYRPWSLEGKPVETAILRDAVPDMRIGLAWHRGAGFSDAMTILQHYFHRQFLQPGMT